jgi:hypothetical protein
MRAFISASKRALLSTHRNQIRTSYDAYQQLKQTFSRPSDNQPGATEDPDGSFLLLLYHVMFVWTSTALTSQETAYDVYFTSFSAVTHLASSILHAWTTSTADAGPGAGAFVFESELIPALYWVATKCRHAGVRRNALQLLLHPLLLARRENLWDARESNKVATRIMKVEEWHATKLRTSTTRMNGRGPIPLLARVSATETVAAIRKDGGVVDSNTAAGHDEDGSASSTPGEHAELGRGVPYEIPEACRVKFGVVGPRDNSGTWLTIYMDAQEGVPGQWRSGKEYVRWT